MQSCVLILGKPAHPVFAAEKMQKFNPGRVAGVWLAGSQLQPGAFFWIHPGDSTGVIPGQVNAAQKGAVALPWAFLRLCFRLSPCRQQPGKAARSAWLGEHCFCFLFLVQGGFEGQAASSTISRSRSFTREKKGEVIEPGIFFIFFRVVSG